jgi:hypothetical protein
VFENDTWVKGKPTGSYESPEAALAAIHDAFLQNRSIGSIFAPASHSVEPTERSAWTILARAFDT